MATFINDLRLTELATGEASGSWGTTTNVSLELLGEAMGVGAEAIANASTHTITMADGATDQFRSTFLRLTGGGQACTVTLAPNTVSHFWVMRNETAAALTLTQGSGANVVIAAGQTKLVCTDGAGSGAVVYEMDDLELAGNLVVDGDASIGDDLSLISDSAVLKFGADGDTTLTHTDGTGLTLNSTNKLTFGDTATFIHQSSNGVMTIDGEATIDLNASTAVLVSNDLKLNSDSAVLGFGADNDTTLTHTDGAGLTLNSTNKIMFNDATQFIQGISGTVLGLAATDEIDLTATAIDVNGTMDVSGAFTNGSTLVSTGKITADAGIDIDNINIDGTTIALSSGDLTLDAAGDIILDADGADVIFKDGGTQIGRIRNVSSGEFTFQSDVSDKDIIFNGNDGGSTITALTLDMSAAGAATFNSTGTFAGGNANFTNDADVVTLNGSLHTRLLIDTSSTGGHQAALVLESNGTQSIIGNTGSGTSISVATGDLTLDVAGDINLDADGADINLKDGGTAMGRIGFENGDLNIASSQQDYDIHLKGNDGGSVISALRLDMSAAGAATFNSTVTATGSTTGGSGTVDTLTIKNTGTSAGDGPRIQFTSGTSTSGAAIAGSGVGANSADLLFYSGGNNERMRLVTNGRLLVGATSALRTNETLQVDGTEGIVARSTADGGGAVVALEAATNANGFDFAAVQAGGGVVFGVRKGGNVQNTNNSYGALSDLKLKENIADAVSQWDDLKAVRVRNYSLIADDESSANRIGVVAQELEASGMSGLVSEHADFDEETKESLGTTTKSVKYSVLYMKAIKALQEAMTRIETLEAKVQTLENN